MIGYTTDYTVAVWQGADMVDSAAKALSSEQAKTTQVIMADVMKKVSDKQVPATFEKPAGIETKNGVEYAKERNTETDICMPVLTETQFIKLLSHKNNVIVVLLLQQYSTH